jgi:Spy/CpxP family protein refolding chaperone
MTKVMVIIGFLIAFAAGITVGVNVGAKRIATAPPSTRPTRGRGPLSELNLSPAQQEQLKKIWAEGSSSHGREQSEKRAKLRQERDEAIAALIPGGDKAKYDAVIKSYTDQMNAMEREMRESFDRKVAQTKEILTSEQRTKYEEVLKRGPWGGSENGGGGGGHRGREFGRRGEERAATRPTVQP